MDMEELLNKLIEKGWKPFGSNCERYEHGCLIHEFRTKDGVYSYGQYPTTIREFCAKESGLWQFVCENGMVKMKEGYYWQNIALIHSEEYDYCDYQYWLIESSLKDESELEQFLLDNINIDD